MLGSAAQTKTRQAGRFWHTACWLCNFSNKVLSVACGKWLSSLIKASRPSFYKRRDKEWMNEMWNVCLSNHFRDPTQSVLKKKKHHCVLWGWKIQKETYQENQWNSSCLCKNGTHWNAMDKLPELASLLVRWTRICWHLTSVRPVHTHCWFWNTEFGETIAWQPPSI